MRPSLRWALAGALLLGSFALGRFTVSERVVTKVETQVEYRERIVEKRVEGPVRERIVTRTTPGPQGPTVYVDRVIERGPVVTDRTTDGEGTSLTRSLTVRDPQPRWMVGASAGLHLTSPLDGIAWGGEVRYRFAGPFWLGVAGNQRGDAALTLSVTF